MTATGPSPEGEVGRPTVARDEGASPSTARPVLSVVVVTRNEADRLERALDAVFRACEDGPPFEVIVVDSASTDGTLDIATAYPATVYRLSEDAVLTPAAGRYVGTRAARGDRLLFVDGDMVLDPEWLRQALEAIAVPGVAGVDGHLNEVADGTEARDVDAVRGVALYEASVLEAVGGFDPFLRSVEDIDLGYRLRDAGYRLRRLGSVAATHPESTTLLEPFRRWRNGYPLGPGQAIRRSLGRPTLLVQHLRRLRYKLLAAGWLAVGALALVSPPLLVGWVALSAGGAAALTLRLGPRGAAQYALNVGLGLLGLLPGFLLPVRPRAAFPAESVSLVKDGATRNAVGGG